MPSLFTTADLVAAPAVLPSGAMVRRQPLVRSKQRVVSARAELEALVGEVQPDELIEYWTGGKWSAHDLLLYLLDWTGPAAVRLATWTITEDPARQIRAAMDDGRITELRMLFDRRLPSRSPAAYQYARALGVPIRLVDNHAKVITLIGHSRAAVVISSQNVTRNKRIEAGMIHTKREAAMWWQERIDEEFKRASDE